MEGMQCIQHRVVYGTYQAVLHWKIQNSKIYIKEADEWIETNIPVRFVKDYELVPVKEEIQ